MSERFKVTKAAEPDIETTNNSNLKDEEAALGKLLPTINEKKGE